MAGDVLTQFLDNPNRSVALMHRRCRAGASGPRSVGERLVTLLLEGDDGDTWWSCEPPPELARDDSGLLERYLAAAPQLPTAMFDHLYGELPADLAAQREALAND